MSTQHTHRQSTASRWIYGVLGRRSQAREAQDHPQAARGTARGPLASSARPSARTRRVVRDHPRALRRAVRDSPRARATSSARPSARMREQSATFRAHAASSPRPSARTQRAGPRLRACDEQSATVRRSARRAVRDRPCATVRAHAVSSPRPSARTRRVVRDRPPVATTSFKNVRLLPTANLNISMVLYEVNFIALPFNFISHTVSYFI